MTTVPSVLFALEAFFAITGDGLCTGVHHCVYDPIEAWAYQHHQDLGKCRRGRRVS
ncbi:MAG: hypothetical protein ACRERE_32765 [Candidatus Entotheonellia bacterium]